MNDFSIVIDTREQTPWRFPEDQSVLRGTLKTGDYSLATFEHRLAIERKSLSDLVACVTKERPRFERELARLAAMEFAIIVVEADIDDVLSHKYRSLALPNSVIGSVVSWTLEYCPVLFAGSPENGARLALKFLKKWHQKNAAIEAA